MNRVRIQVVLGFVLGVLLLWPAAAMESPGYAIHWDVMGSGGQPARSSSYALRGTIGQVSIGFGSNPGYEWCAGYWCGATVEYVYLPIVIRHSPQSGNGS
jgi:hypothetical protein